MYSFNCGFIFEFGFEFELGPRGYQVYKVHDKVPMNKNLVTYYFVSYTVLKVIMTGLLAHFYVTKDGQVDPSHWTRVNSTFLRYT